MSRAVVLTGLGADARPLPAVERQSDAGRRAHSPVWCDVPLEILNFPGEDGYPGRCQWVVPGRTAILCCVGRRGSPSSP